MAKESKSKGVGTKKCQFKETVSYCSFDYCNYSKTDCKYKGRDFPYVNRVIAEEWSRKPTCNLSSLF